MRTPTRSDVAGRRAQARREADRRHGLTRPRRPGLPRVASGVPASFPLTTRPALRICGSPAGMGGSVARTVNNSKLYSISSTDQGVTFTQHNSIKNVRHLRVSTFRDTVAVATVLVRVSEKALISGPRLPDASAELRSQGRLLGFRRADCYAGAANPTPGATAPSCAPTPTSLFAIMAQTRTRSPPQRGALSARQSMRSRARLARLSRSHRHRPAEQSPTSRAVLGQALSNRSELFATSLGESPNHICARIIHHRQHFFVRPGRAKRDIDDKA